MNKKIGIIDTGYSNIASVINAVNYLGFNYKVEKNPLKINNFSHIILPGVGSFFENSKIIHKNGWADEIKNIVHKNIYLFGICVGMQLMFSSGEEGKNKSKGLSFFSGNCSKFKKKNIRLPHIGFNNVKYSNSKIWNGIPDNSPFYFVHSYRIINTDTKNLCSHTVYGEKFISFIEYKNIFASQFHPEKSHKVGLKLLQNFLNL